MKKVFTFALVALAAAAVVACQKPASDGTTPGGDTPSGGDYVAIQSIAMDPDVLELEEGESIDLPKVVVTPSNATDKGMAVTWSSKDQNIFKIENNKVVGVKAGTAKIEAILKDSKGTEFGAQANVTVKAAVPEGNTWDYVMDIKDYRINSTFMFDEVNKRIDLNPNGLAFQWKFYSNKWNNHKFQDKDEHGYQLYCNRLGEFSNAAENQTVLLRFSNDGSADGQLCLNCDFLGTGQQQVAKDGKAFVWPTEEWCVLTLTTDGTNISLYCNADLVATYAQSGQVETWKFQRFDISMTWKEGNTENDWPLRQAFNGAIAYTRVWSKGLSAEDVAASLCDIPANTEGLEVYWVYNLDEGSVIENKVAANSEYKLDFSKAWNGNGGKNNTAQYAEASWSEPAQPVCGLLE